MTVVHKYPIPFRRVAPGMRFALELPRDARFLSCAIQHDDPVTWWEVDPDKGTVTRYFAYFHTGQSFAPASRTYLGMLMSNDGGTWIGHLYELHPPLSL